RHTRFSRDWSSDVCSSDLGMELHVWLNPYRAFHTTGGAVTAESMVKRMPSEIVKLRNGAYWFDPANPKTQEHVSNVVKDIVKRKIGRASCRERVIVYGRAA